MNLSVGVISCCLSGQLTAHGDRYWRIGGKLTEPAKGPPIWNSEVEWLVEKFDDIAETLAPEIFKPSQCEYPLAFRPKATQALAILLSRSQNSTEIWIERWSAVQPNASSKSNVQFSTYWYCNRPFSSYSRLRLPLGNDWRKNIKDFAHKWRELLRQTAIEQWTGLREHDGTLPADQPPDRRVLVTISNGAGNRRVQYYPFCPQPRDPIVLAKPLRRLLLEACNTPRTAQQAAQMAGFVEVNAARGELAWTARYDDDTLREAVFLTTIRIDGQDHLSATFRPPSFLADPLLTALAPLSHNAQLQGHLGPSPQRPEGLPVTQLRAAGLIEDRLLGSAIGDYPKPVSAEAENTRAAAASALRMNQERWKLLQWLDIESRCQANLHALDQKRRALAWQRLSLLRFDGLNSLSEQSSSGHIGELLANAKDCHALSIAGKLKPSLLRRSKDLPKPGSS